MNGLDTISELESNKEKVYRKIKEPSKNSNMSVIIKSGKKNWSGKEFSNLPAKIYSSFDDAVTALKSYHFFRFDHENCDYVPCEKKQKIEITHLTESNKRKLLSAGRIRW